MESIVRIFDGMADGKREISLDRKARRLIGYDQDDRSFRAAGALSRDSFGFRRHNDLAQLAALRAGLINV
jgi:hypothetical protein